MMIQDKAMIIIAVSKYTGAYDDLPGAITSARRLRKWAKQRDEDCNYNVLYLADDVYEKINIQLVREKVRDFINNNFIDRLVVYFAGHGIVRSAGEQFWLLADASIDIEEGIDVEGFRRGLLKCNIGTSNDNFAGQLCIIGDACRNSGRDAIDFKGHPIITSTAKMNRRIQLDRFLSTSLGDYSFQINQTGSQSAYCLFSEVMLSALRGEVEDAIERKFHQYSPVVTNHKLSEYLEKEVRKCAAAIQEEMEPDLLTGIHPPNNFYKIIEKSPHPGMTAHSQDQTLTSAIQMAIKNSYGGSSKKQLAVDQKYRKSIFSRLKYLFGGSSKEQLAVNREYRKHILSLLKENITYYHGRILDHRKYLLDFLTLIDFREGHIAVPRNATVEEIDYFKFSLLDDSLKLIRASDCYGSPILVKQDDDQWIIIPNYPNVVTVASRSLPGDILFLKTGYGVRQDELLDTYLSDFSNLVGNVPLRAADAQKFADRIRVGKEKYPHQSVTAGYLYEFSNDYDNIARTAHYMYRNTGKVPFDLALLCAEKVLWRKENERLFAFADLPAVEPSQPTNNQESRPYYAQRGFEAREDVRLLGIAPINSQGWNFMQTERYLEIPEKIRLIGKNVSGRSAASLTDEGAHMFIEAFGYQVVWHF